MIYTITLNPAVDRELRVDEMEFDTVIRAVESRVDFGGKGFNVARMLRTLNTDSVVMGLAGGKSGEVLEEGLQSLGIKTDFIWIEGETRTNVSIVKADTSHYLKVNESGPTISKKSLEDLAEKIKKNVRPGDWWVLAGSLPPGVPTNVYADFIRIIESGGAHTILDTSGEALRFGCVAKPFLVKPNLEEACQLTSTQCKTTTDIISVGRIIQKIGPENVVISMGKDGALLISDDKTGMVNTPDIVERNPIGAGDAMVGGLVWGLSQGKPLSEALQCGIACGAVTASQNGTDMGSYDMVVELLPQIHFIE